MIFQQNKRRRSSNRKKGNYTFRSKKAAPAAETVHILHFNPETEASLREKKRDRHRREFRVAVALIGVMALLGVAHMVMKEAFLENPSFQLRDFSVETDGGLTVDEIEQATQVHKGENLLMISMRTVRERLEALPDVRKATVTRNFPGILNIHLEQRQPAVVLQCAPSPTAPGKPSYRCVLDAERVVLSDTRCRGVQEALPIITVDKSMHLAPGQIADAQPVKDAFQLIQLHQSSPLAETHHLASIDASGKISLQAVYAQEGLTVTFSRHELEKQMHRLESVIRSAAESHRTLASVNLLVEKYVPVTFRQTTAATPVHAAPARPASPSHSLTAAR